MTFSPDLSPILSARGPDVLNYALRRLLTLPVVLFALSVMLFALQMSLSPTQRLAAYAPSPDFLKGGQDSIRRMIEQYGLNDPFHIQWLVFPSLCFRPSNAFDLLFCP